jgi:hypothetical protein
MLVHRTRHRYDSAIFTPAKYNSRVHQYRFPGSLVLLIDRIARNRT